MPTNPLTAHERRIINDVSIGVTKILQKLPDNLSRQELGLFVVDAINRFSRGWSFVDVWSHFLCHEEIDPTINEQEACDRMLRLDIKYDDTIHRTMCEQTKNHGDLCPCDTCKTLRRL